MSEQEAKTRCEHAKRRRKLLNELADGMVGRREGMGAGLNPESMQFLAMLEVAEELHDLNDTLRDVKKDLGQLTNSLINRA